MYLSLNLSTSEEIESKINVETMTFAIMRILSFVLYFIFREKRDKSKNKRKVKFLIKLFFQILCYDLSYILLMFLEKKYLDFQIFNNTKYLINNSCHNCKIVNNKQFYNLSLYKK